MQSMIFNPFASHGLKRPQSNVQCDLGGLDPALSHACKNFRCEVQSRGRSRDRSTLLRVHGLITLAWQRGNIAVPALGT